jgi:hypothetical protein
MYFKSRCQKGIVEDLGDAEKSKGIMVGVIALFFLLFPVFWYLSMVMAPFYYDYMPGLAGTLTFLFFLGSNLFGVIFAVLTKVLLKRSTMFGAAFILSALLNFYVFIKMGFRVSYGWGMLSLLLYALPLATSLVGLSLIVEFSSVNHSHSYHGN